MISCSLNEVLTYDQLWGVTFGEIHNWWKFYEKMFTSWNSMSKSCFSWYFKCPLWRLLFMNVSASGTKRGWWSRWEGEERKGVVLRLNHALLLFQQGDMLGWLYSSGLNNHYIIQHSSLLIVSDPPVCPQAPGLNNFFHKRNYKKHNTTNDRLVWYSSIKSAQIDQ